MNWIAWYLVRFLPAWAILLAGLATFTGCGAEQSTVEGTVLLPDKTPATNVVVNFSDPGNQIGATGTTDANGVYRLSTNDLGEGVPPGVYQVSVAEISTHDSSQPEPPPRFARRYADPRASNLTYEVKPGENRFDIQLQAQ